MNSKILQAEIIRSLEETILTTDQVVVVFSGIWMFGNQLGVPLKQIPEYMLEILTEFIGRERTLVFPTYTDSYAKTRVFDTVRSKAETGVLPNYVLGQPGFIRTQNAMNSYAVWGQRKEEVFQLEPQTLWGKNSVLEWCDQVNARVVVLGETWGRACTHIHRSEELARVPYRYYKKFPGLLQQDGVKAGPTCPVAFVRPLGVPCEQDLSVATRVLEEQNLILKGSHSRFPIESAKAPDISRACTQLLLEDPFAFVPERAPLENWIASGGIKAEMQALALSEQCPELNFL